MYARSPAHGRIPVQRRRPPGSAYRSGDRLPASTCPRQPAPPTNGSDAIAQYTLAGRGLPKLCRLRRYRGVPKWIWGNCERLLATIAAPSCVRKLCGGAATAALPAGGWSSGCAHHGARQGRHREAYARGPIAAQRNAGLSSREGKVKAIGGPPSLTYAIRRPR